jgi:hypothetical protein
MPIMQTEVTQPAVTARRKRVRWLFAGMLLLSILAAFLAWRNDAIKAYASKAVAIVTASAKPAGEDKKYETSDSPVVVGPLNRLPSRALSTGGADDEETSFLAEIFKGQVPEICGLSTEEAKAYIATKGASTDRLGARALAETIGKLLQSDNARERTLGLYLRAHEAGYAAMQSEELNYPGCKPGQPCSERPYEAMRQARANAVEPLIEYALKSGDVDAYAAALHGCGNAKIGACSSISYEGWAKIEPDNASVWLTIAGEAESRKDIPARTLALQRAAASSTYNPRVPLLAAAFNAAPVLAESTLVQSQIIGRLIGVDAAVSLGHFSVAGRLCGRAEKMDEERRALCDSIATTFVEKDQSLLGLRMGQTIGARAGWDAVRIQQLQDEYTIATGRLYQMFADGKMLSCESMENINRWARSVHAVGERGAVREFVAKSGKSMAQLAKEYRKFETDITK